MTSIRDQQSRWQAGCYSVRVSISISINIIIRVHMVDRPVFAPSLWNRSEFKAVKRGETWDS
ncbi:hypothetical protein FPSE_05588 [Fusarium pseudograminearum CS3096]|uniref:Uncharacterized protein n=1 Tax=Fusarium pseudograminearum (strain CS3096) TaxID=1028729 RepID=K3UPQ4_FUSPC|nr:hypothetical protein FPSE_05588 [Fusarium pseudograminearum CS3096]EKJ74291.1 hypothetical protein FPSE_05588 [Fusarium pseudograminearum CS3096]